MDFHALPENSKPLNTKPIKKESEKPKPFHDDLYKKMFIDSVAKSTANHIKEKTLRISEKDKPESHARILKKVRENLEIDKYI